jgi:nicotinamidase/pyrazinamidase
MVSPDVVFWQVDTQADFMLPGGKLYVPGAEKLLPRIKRLTAAARAGQVFLVSQGCFHPRDDPEFQVFAPHCVQGTPGSNIVPEALTERLLRIPNTADAKLPENLESFQQLLLEKQTLDIFASRHADALVERLGTRPEFVVFGVVTEYCVGLAAKGLLRRGRRVSLVEDAIETLTPQEGRRTVAELRALGAQMITTEEALGKLKR